MKERLKQLIEHEGWRKYNNKWLFHQPKNYGAFAGMKVQINNTYYEFDSDGYLK